MRLRVGLRIFVTLCLLSLLPREAAAGWHAGEVLPSSVSTPADTDGYFEICLIDDSLLLRMRRGGSFPEGCQVSRSELRYLKLLHYNYDGRVQKGELVCNKAIAEDLLAIFKELFRQKYQIFRMALIDDYGASDEASMSANNTSAFCYRKVSGSARLSKHAQGLAVDINPLHNPCVKYNASGGIQKIEPDTPEARKYASRSSGLTHAIDRNDLCYRLFIQHGFRWGGAWRSKKDYQHFEK